MLRLILIAIGLALFVFLSGALACSAPEALERFTPRGATCAWWGSPCDPGDPRACLELAVATGGWCEPAHNGVPAQCVLATCENAPWECVASEWGAYNALGAAHVIEVCR